MKSNITRILWSYSGLAIVLGIAGLVFNRKLGTSNFRTNSSASLVVGALIGILMLFLTILVLGRQGHGKSVQRIVFVAFTCFPLVLLNICIVIASYVAPAGTHSVYRTPEPMMLTMQMVPLVFWEMIVSVETFKQGAWKKTPIENDAHSSPDPDSRLLN